MKYKAIIFDLDGTLVRTAPEYRYKIVGQTLKELGTTNSKENIDKFWFEARRDEVIQKHFGLDPKLFWKTYRPLDTSELRQQYTELYDDVDFVKEIKQKGYKTGIVTGAPLYIANLEISMIGKEYFDAVVVANSQNGIKPKPHPHGLEECLSLLEVQSNETMYVGNADEDVIAAKNAQIFDVLLLRGEHKFPGIQSSLTISSLYELRQLLE